MVESVRRRGYGLALFVACVVIVFAPGEAAHADCGSPANAIEAENCLTGNPASEWEITGAGDANLQGFATDISVNRGGTVSFKVTTTATAYRIDIYRLGYYGGDGARLVATVANSSTVKTSQPACVSPMSTTGLVDCGNWSVSASWAVPSTAVSGIYIARLVGESGGIGASHMVFVVRQDGGSSDVLFQTSDTTWLAHNRYGGANLDGGSGPGVGLSGAGRAYKVSYNRPFTTREYAPEDWVFNAEYPMVRWLERNGYDVSYFTGVDADRRGVEIARHRVFLSVGHDEYWSGQQRLNVEKARDGRLPGQTSPVHLAFFSGNEIFWKTRWESSIDGASTPYRTLVCYKETHTSPPERIDSSAEWTGTWRDPRFSPPSDGGRPENAISGTISMVNGIRDDSIEVPEADARMRFWRNTPNVATLATGQHWSAPLGTLGHEWDEDLDNGHRPPGLVRLSTTALYVDSGVVQDSGSLHAPGRATHHLVFHKRANGARVFGAGTIQWSWGLDSNHDRGSDPESVDMQQATVNLLADMGVQPATMQTDLVSASASTDVIAPVSDITSPAKNAAVTLGAPVTIQGTASDGPPGRVGGVEVSVDGGSTWHPAAGRSSWSYVWTPTAGGTYHVLSRAVDDSGNIESPGAGWTIVVAAPVPATPAAVTNTSSAAWATQAGDTVPPAGWYAGDMHVHRSCGGSPESVSSLYNKMADNNLATISLLADMGNGEVQNPATDLPRVNGLDDPISTSGRTVHWDAEWHWDPTYTQYPHQALGGHVVALGLTEARAGVGGVHVPDLPVGAPAKRNRRVCPPAVPGRRHPAVPQLLSAARVPGRSRARFRRLHLGGRVRQRLRDRGLLPAAQHGVPPGVCRRHRPSVRDLGGGIALDLRPGGRRSDDVPPLDRGHRRRQDRGVAQRPERVPQPDRERDRHTR